MNIETKFNIQQLVAFDNMLDGSGFGMIKSIIVQPNRVTGHPEIFYKVAVCGMKEYKKVNEDSINAYYDTTKVYVGA